MKKEYTSRQHLVYNLTNDEYRDVVERKIVEAIKEAMEGYFQRERLSGIQPEFTIGEIDWEQQTMCQNSNSGDTV